MIASSRSLAGAASPSAASASASARCRSYEAVPRRNRSHMSTPLQRHVTVLDEVARTIDARHAALPEVGLKLVTIRDPLHARLSIRSGAQL